MIIIGNDWRKYKAKMSRGQSRRVSTVTIQRKLKLTRNVVKRSYSNARWRNLPKRMLRSFRRSLRLVRSMSRRDTNLSIQSRKTRIGLGV